AGHARLLGPPVLAGLAGLARFGGAAAGLGGRAARAHVGALRDDEVLVDHVLRVTVVERFVIVVLGPRTHVDDLRRRRVRVAPLLADRIRAVAHHARARGAKARDPALREHAHAFGELRRLALDLFEGDHLVDAAEVAHRELALGPED